MLWLGVGRRGRVQGGWGCLRQQHPLPTPEREGTVGIKCAVPKPQKIVSEMGEVLTMNLTTIFEQRRLHVQFTCPVNLSSAKVLSPQSTILTTHYFPNTCTGDLRCKYTCTPVQHTSKKKYFSRLLR